MSQQEGELPSAGVIDMETRNNDLSHMFDNDEVKLDDGKEDKETGEEAGDSGEKAQESANMFENQDNAELEAGDAEEGANSENTGQDGAEEDEEDDVYAIKAHKLDGEAAKKEVTKKKNVRKTKSLAGSANDNSSGFVPMRDSPEEGNNDSLIANEDPESRRRRILEERMDLAMKTKSVRRRKADEDDLERMQDDKIDNLKDRMIRAANMDIEKNSQGQVATEKLKLLREVTDVLSKADLAISILDNNLLEAIRLWIEPLPDASMPAYQIQKELITALTTLPIKTDHLVASGIGKVLVFYQRSKRTEPNMKKIVDRLIGDWTRPILNKSDSYKDRTIQFHEYNKRRYINQLSSQRRNRPKESKTLYEESAERRKRAAIPSARTSAYKIAPKVDVNALRRNAGRGDGNNDERFKRLNQKLTSMNIKKKTSKKSGPSIEGKNLTL